MSPRAETRLGARIRAVEAIPLRIPFRRTFTMATAHQPTREHVDVLVVRITSEDGRIGLGETQAWRRQGSGETLPSLFAKVRDIAAPLLVGRSALDLNLILSETEKQLAGNLYVQAAIGDALYDLAARCLDLPVHDLLGGRFRDEIPVGLAIGISGDEAGMVAAAEEAVGRGYRHIRIKIGLDAAKDLRCASALRKRFGDSIVLRADANGGMNYGDALALLSKLEPLDFDIVEQPVAGWDLDGMAALARAIRIPLSADESVTSAHSLVEVAKRGAARVFQSKSAKNGGLHSIRRLWTLGETLGMGIFPGNHPSTGLNVAAVAHLAAAWPGELLVGDFQTGCDDMIAGDILQEPVRIADGKVTVPQGPGFGVQLDEAKLRKYRWE
jgi:L-alanine-DL-glutamate epimerase-like enolase superfamily enzyme